MEPLDRDQVEIRRRNLPHWEVGGAVYHVVFKSLLPLADDERRAVVGAIRRGEGAFFDLKLGCVMEDHVHLILRPGEVDGKYHRLSRITAGIKGASVREINLIRGTGGPVWQSERYDRLIRGPREYIETYDYVFGNPVLAGLCLDPGEYEFTLFPNGWIH